MKKYLVGNLKCLSLLKLLKMKRKFTYTFVISNTCKLEVFGTATQHPDHDEWEDTYSWEIDRMCINDIWLTDAMMEFINETYSNKMDLKLEEYIYDLFRNDEEDMTTDIKQDRPEIFGELTDQNPVYGC